MAVFALFALMLDTLFLAPTMDIWRPLPGWQEERSVTDLEIALQGCREALALRALDDD